MQAKIAALLVAAVFDYLRKHPEIVDGAIDRITDVVARVVGERLERIVPELVDAITDAIPGTLDDRLFDGLAAKLVPAVDAAMRGVLKSLPIIGSNWGR